MMSLMRDESNQATLWGSKGKSSPTIYVTFQNQQANFPTELRGKHSLQDFFPLFTQLFLSALMRTATCNRTQLATYHTVKSGEKLLTLLINDYSDDMLC